MLLHTSQSRHTSAAAWRLGFILHSCSDTFNTYNTSKDSIIPFPHQTIAEMTTSMLELVDELLIAIIDHINDLAALHSLARTCHRLNGLAEPAIYRDILLRGRNHTSALATSLVSRPERLQAIRSIEARPQYNHQECRLYVLESIIRRAPKLQQLTVESPFCNHVQYREATYGWEESMRALLRPICHFSIARLTSRTSTPLISDRNLPC